MTNRDRVLARREIYLIEALCLLRAAFDDLGVSSTIAEITFEKEEDLRLVQLQLRGLGDEKSQATFKFKAKENNAKNDLVLPELFADGENDDEKALTALICGETVVFQGIKINLAKDLLKDDLIKDVSRRDGKVFVELHKEVKFYVVRAGWA